MRRIKELICISLIVLASFGTMAGAKDSTLSMMTYNLKFASSTYEPSWGQLYYLAEGLRIN